jgi:hypothetical protein
MPIPFSPITPTQLLCLGCAQHMRLVVEEYKAVIQNKKVSRILFYCDTCKYGYEPSMQHATGNVIPYVAPSNPNLTSAESKVASGG